MAKDAAGLANAKHEPRCDRHGYCNASVGIGHFLKLSWYVDQRKEIYNVNHTKKLFTRAKSQAASSASHRKRASFGYLRPARLESECVLPMAEAVFFENGATAFAQSGNGRVDRSVKKLERQNLLLQSKLADKDGKQAIVDYCHDTPLEGYRRLCYMIVDDDIVAVSPSSAYRVLSNAGLLKGKNFPTPGLESSLTMARSLSPGILRSLSGSAA